jgi:hypothetical protein
MSYDAIKKEKKKMSTLVNFQTRDQGHHTKNTIHEKITKLNL